MSNINVFTPGGNGYILVTYVHAYLRKVLGISNFKAIICARVESISKIMGVGSL